jgi:eukaryotic-like serine/threonine-protein kinase
LSGEHTTREDFTARFQREARALSSFSHPNICTVYDFGMQEGQHFLVMKYLEGETLAVRLPRGPMRLDEFFAICTAARGWAEAHRRGHIHRDLKPANVMLTRTGAKLLDFGLVRVVGSDHSPVPDGLTRSITSNGGLVGTVPYMSPEQLQGREADARSDIFSFGAVLYEMATGRQAFQGDTAASVIAAILKPQPAQITGMRTGLPEPVVWIISTCLNKRSLTPAVGCGSHGRSRHQE